MTKDIDHADQDRSAEAGADGNRIDASGGQDGAEAAQGTDQGRKARTEGEPASRPAESERPILAEYKIGLAYKCPHCEQAIIITQPTMIEAGLHNASFDGPCQKCQAPITLRPSQTFIAKPSPQVQPRNRHERRIIEASAR